MCNKLNLECDNRGCQERIPVFNNAPIHKLTWNELRSFLLQYNEIHNKAGYLGLIKPLKAVAVFSSNNWPEANYPLEARSYMFSSDNKIFHNNMVGHSCYAESLDGSDPRVDIMKYNWEIEYCYLL